MATDSSPLLICNPDEPGWFHGVANVASVADYYACQHPIRISAAGVGLLLTTPGLQTVCLRCIPRDRGPLVVPAGIRAQFEQETGRPLSPEIISIAEVVADFVAAHNPPRR
jgi:hypothetical protein